MNNTTSGILEIDPKGTGFLRTPSMTMALSKSDVLVPPGLIQKLSLRPGLIIEGTTQPGKKMGTLTEIKKVNGISPEEWRGVEDFSTYEVIQPQKALRLWKPGDPISMRVLETFCPLGCGQRALIVAPPKAGKTRLLQQLAHAVSEYQPEMDLLVLLIDERPEEVTDMKRSIRGEVYASSSDSEGNQHMRLAKLVLEYAKRKVEQHKDVVLLIDSLTRIGRAFNVHQKGTGRTLSGGLDARALEVPKRIFGAARNIEFGGSLTIMATALIETNSRMDELIFQEFKGTGNSEIVLSRELADQRIFPAIDLQKSGTRNEELLWGDRTAVYQKMRRAVSEKKPTEAMQDVLGILSKVPDEEGLIKLFS